MRLTAHRADPRHRRPASRATCRWRAGRRSSRHGPGHCPGPDRGRCRGRPRAREPVGHRPARVTHTRRGGVEQGRRCRLGRVTERAAADMQGQQRQKDRCDRQRGRGQDPAWPDDRRHRCGRFPTPAGAGTVPTPTSAYRPFGVRRRGKTPSLAQAGGPQPRARRAAKARWRRRSRCGPGRADDRCARYPPRFPGPPTPLSPVQAGGSLAGKDSSLASSTFASSLSTVGSAAGSAAAASASPRSGCSPRPAAPPRPSARTDRHGRPGCLRAPRSERPLAHQLLPAIVHDCLLRDPSST